MYHLFENSSCQAALAVAHEVFICHSVLKTRVVPWNMVADQFFSGLMLCKIETCAKKLYWSVSGICLWCFAKLSMCDMAKEKGDVSQKI